MDMRQKIKIIAYFLLRSRYGILGFSDCDDKQTGMGQV